MRALLLALLVLTPALSGCVFGIGREPLIIAASAPKSESAMTLFLVTNDGYFDQFREESASYAIYYGDRLIYPPAGKGALFDMSGRTGTAVVPYNYFVVGNGAYDVVVRYGGEAARVRVQVEKWAEYVWLHPFDKGDNVLVEVALSSATGGRPDDRILSRGELILTIHYHGADGKRNQIIGQVTAETRNDRAATPVSVPTSRLNQGSGYYSFEPLFHNLEARDNLQVGPDPTMGNMRPPWNWIYVAS